MENKKDLIIGIIVLVVIGISVLYTIFTEPISNKIPTAEEEKALEKKILDRYGSWENAEYQAQQNEQECFNPPLCR
ncbi:MAG: hypothetical protein A2528_02030 [Candidatus Staskawiczbacteria bacterium RIFOXYD2_FULL_37_9]|uniref:Uncharacterized protein n=1 Tax=Candidatus Staskawiczbacteria bacterium RIFOXYB1_FULL_37_44 TaxID=1802223 RepID=A0A1G2IUY3_9BACT|nr:MAG: hypothetical protein A2358_02845 [Candidatus Staskawiczbacteria bacterium RIFOXYB1_FULL_37_44]OGZ83862.1 MAG: hypothetical protein A2416_02560 [Candidatus Staskawiczbacteria bacterium RIFOXYC1_FULL_37_52]OGZ87590.1 MAG: hypothetical protein A2444_03810 [Candidatus Staskawiczbacteria bacterium RIFOXYC2_FULL_37_19]OGZ89369.1 MAG: hypothetical protein A2581_00620 [Candidatus Staskawiczbacteria bacterium RIFOXYD1_FULL_37_110]OGZ94817.1 MAG: hypothetical protein A2528_02030 [Candidatus Stask